MSEIADGQATGSDSDLRGIVADAGGDTFESGRLLRCSGSLALIGFHALS